MNLVTIGHLPKSYTEQLIFNDAAYQDTGWSVNSLGSCKDYISQYTLLRT